MSGSLDMPDDTRVNFWWHHPNSRNFTCKCGEVREWAPILETDHSVKRSRCMVCGQLHVRAPARRYQQAHREPESEARP